MSRLTSSLAEFFCAIANWVGILGLLMVAEIDKKFQGSRLGILFALAEPIVLITMMILLRTAIRHQFPVYGTSTAVFISSGIFPFYVFLRVSLRARGARYEAVQRLPRVSSTDLLIASAMAETALILALMVMWFAGMWVYGLNSAQPVSIVDCLIPLFLLATLGFGVGLVSSAIARGFSLWTYIYAYLTYGLIFVSGVFYIVDLLPLFLRNIVVWNPIAHGVEWFRLGLYGHYLVHTLDREYLIVCAGVSLFLGFVSHRATLRTV